MMSYALQKAWRPTEDAPNMRLSTVLKVEMTPEYPHNESFAGVMDRSQLFISVIGPAAPWNVLH
jgi:hypothetical protein